MIKLKPKQFKDINSGSVPILIGCLEHFSLQMKKECSWILFTISSSKSEYIETLLKYKIDEKLIKLLTIEDDPLSEHCR